MKSPDSLLGCFIFGTFILELIPVASLLGIFLYFGVMNMLGCDMLERAILFFVPVKYHPHVKYCTQVSSAHY